MSRHITPLNVATLIAVALGLAASLLIGLTQVVHNGIPLAIYAGSLMFLSLGGGIVLDRRRLAPARS